MVGLTAGLAAGEDMREVFARFLPSIVQVAGARAGAVRVLDDQGRHMDLVAEFGLPSEVVEAERSVVRDCGLCGASLDAHAVGWRGRIAPCAGHSEHRLAAAGMRGTLAVPLARRARVLGVFNLFYDEAGEPSAELLVLLRSIGDLLGLALDNARLERENLRAALAEERQAIAAEVHDSIGQSLAFVKMRLPLLQDAMHGGDAAQAARYFDDVRSAVGQAHASLRAVLTRMRAPMDPLGLRHALTACAAEFRQFASTRLEVIDEVPELRLSGACEEQVFRIIQEALANVARHAAARHAWLRLERAEEALQVVVEDDGGGLPVGGHAAGTHYGLAIMRERAQRLGGTLAVGPRAGGGTRVCLRVALVTESGPTQPGTP